MLSWHKDYHRHLTPVLGGDRFFNAFFDWFTAWRSWFSRTARFSLQKAVFYMVFMLKCYYRSRTVLSVVLPCSAGIVFSMQFVRLDCGSIFGSIKAFIAKRCRKRFRRGFETGKMKSVRQWLGRRGKGSSIWIYVYMYNCKYNNNYMYYCYCLCYYYHYYYPYQLLSLSSLL